MLGGRIIQTIKISTAEDMYRLLDRFTQRERSVMDMLNHESNELRIEYIDNDMEDGSHTYDLRVVG